MKKFLIGFLLSILPAAQSYAGMCVPPATMCFPPRNSFTAVSKVSSGNLVASTPRFTLDAGDTIFVHVAKDNVSSVDGETSEIVRVVDSLDPTIYYDKILEFNNGQGKKQAGVVAGMFMRRLNTKSLLDEPFQVTVYFSTTNVVAKAVVVQRVISDYPLVAVASAVLANDNLNPSAMDLDEELLSVDPPLQPDEELLWVRTMGLEGAWVNFFETETYADWGTAGTIGSGGASNIAVAYEADTSTGTSNPSDPIAINADSVSILVAFREDMGAP